MDLKTILKDQKAEIEEKFKRTNFVRREFEEKARDFLKSKLVKVTTGIRRCGKSFFHLLSVERFKIWLCKF